MAHRILIVEDEKDIAELVRFHLVRIGFQAEVHYRGLGGLQAIRENPPSLVVLDLMLPDMDGIEICKQLKFNDATREIPVLILTAKSSEMDRILGLELGADDYLPKPFSPRELVLRVQAILRRIDNRGRSGRPVVAGPLTIDADSHRVFLHGRPLELTPMEFKLLQYLGDRRGRVARREDLLNSVWGYQYTGGTRTVDTHVQRLRSKFGELGKWIETVRGVGYRLRDPDAEDQ